MLLLFYIILLTEIAIAISSFALWKCVKNFEVDFLETGILRTPDDGRSFQVDFNLTGLKYTGYYRVIGNRWMLLAE
jgi:hypothetical protein